MTTYRTPHTPDNKVKLASMVAAIKSGETMPPLVVIGETAITGSHRIAAYDAANSLVEASTDDDWDSALPIEIPTVELCNDDYTQGMIAIGLDPSVDDPREFNDLCTAIYSLTDDCDVKAALADQM